MILIDNLMEVLRDLSDIELQRREWVELQNSTVYFPTEMVSQLFDDTGLSDYLNKDRCPGELDEDAFAELKKLNQATGRLDYLLPPAEFLHTPEMERVRTLAAGILDMLARRRGNPAGLD